MSVSRSLIVLQASFGSLTHQLLAAIALPK